ncbi:MAG TPA: hypothetical protein VMW69_09320 [Spirochaetia bacterium]|nr:hypothetical protein [Spirochaetia bacterium]
MEGLRDLNQQFEDRHARALELFRRGEYVAALDEWKLALTLCAGRPIQEQSVLSGIVEASIRLGEYSEAVEILQRMIARKRERGLNVPAGLIERAEYLKTLQHAGATRSEKRKKS